VIVELFFLHTARSDRKRRMTMEERERLMGFGMKPPYGKKVKLQKPPSVTENQWGNMLGNAIVSSCLQRILVRLLRAANFADASLKDPWEQP
jgi:hypothetical protein